MQKRIAYGVLAFASAVTLALVVALLLPYVLLGLALRFLGRSPKQIAHVCDDGRADPELYQPVAAVALLAICDWAFS